MHDYGAWFWLFSVVVLVAILGLALVYGTGMWRRRFRDRTTEEIRDEATDRLYHKQR
jgi:ABC-type transporter Mla subunit MlaD